MRFGPKTLSDQGKFRQSARREEDGDHKRKEEQRQQHLASLQLRGDRGEERPD